ncbi:MAG: hypothetical protein BWY06_02305 [Candidatus Latescibacteria bacterium ADurb.Bin168]|nr:MAG: hypothetical protein BWY06_02305 [Candidatus Latescibacteria bacterium ADurb.Bin168]
MGKRHPEPPRSPAVKDARIGIDGLRKIVINLHIPVAAGIRQPVDVLRREVPQIDVVPDVASRPQILQSDVISHQEVLVQD